jgi:nicotinic acid phosphoribosyltransferase
MKSGTLNENALKNYKFLAHLIEYQQMLFDFEFFEQKLPMNFPCLILSEGKSLFPNDLSITLKSEYQDITYIEQLLSSEEKIKKIRNYILNLQKIYKEMAISKGKLLI